MEERVWDAVVLGAGAAGMMCAIEAGRSGLRVLVLEHGERVGRKILISGGGRSNFTNLHTRPENFVSENMHFAKSALARYTPEDFIALVERHGIPYHEKTLGQLFCDRSAKDIVTMLECEMGEAGVEIRLGAAVSGIRRIEGGGYRVESNAGSFEARSVVVATGGLSIPKMGATGVGYRIAESFGLRLAACRPGLVPLVFGDDDAGQWSDLAGLSTEVEMTAGKSEPTTSEGDSARGRRQGAPGRLGANGRSGALGKPQEPKARFREKLLITHRGLSGPAVLQASSYWREGAAVGIDLAPGLEVLAPLLERGARRDWWAAAMAVKRAMPARMAERWLTVWVRGWNKGGEVDFASPDPLPNALLAALEAKLHGWELRPAGTEGYGKAEVTAGGVDTAELDPRTLESRRVPGLYFIGEVVDVTGWLGGYNFQWAWASGVAAGGALR